jgi:surfactin synthase thioesterase subunit
MSNTAETRIFSFPYAGGSRYSYNLFDNHLPLSMQWVPLEYPGHGRRIVEPLLYRAEAIADDMYRQIETLTDLPYAFYGHSMGALIGWLVAVRLAAAGKPLPLHLFFSGCGGPSAKRHLGRHLLRDHFFLEELKNMGGMPDELLDDEDSMRFYGPVIRADFEAVDTYVYAAGPKLQIPITVIIGTEETLTMEDAGKWQEVTDIPIRCLEMEGNHFFIQEQAARVMHELYSTLQQRQTGSAGNRVLGVA